MNWLSIALASYFVLSIASMIDKIFLSKVVAASVVYTFWVTALSILMAAVLAVIVAVSQALHLWNGAVVGGLTLMSAGFFMLAVIVGILFTAALFFLYSALQRGEASRVIPVIGGSMPLLIYGMTFFYESLDGDKFIALAFLVAGTVLISHMPRRADARKGGTIRALGSSLSFALFFVLTQFLFREQGFINGVVWPRVGSLIFIAAILFMPRARGQIAVSVGNVAPRIRLAWLGNQALAASGFLGQQFAIALPGVSVALVSALQSVQYVFILVYASLLSFFRPSVVNEYLSRTVIVQKIISLALIAAGLYFIAR